jgi:4-alpha-glucanotransferase
MTYVSGAVPDDFTVDGQIWNTALYNWENNRLGNYEYWINKLQNNLDKFDYLRIDHFVGFFQYWAIPINETALNGEWRKGPWKNFFKEVSKNIPMSKLLAEDLGVILQETNQILKEYNIPGMKVLQQRIPSDGVNKEIHPHDWNQNIIAYTGTHDSPTIGQWFEESNDFQMRSFDEYKQKLKYSYSNDIWNFISLVWESPAILSVTTIQDVLNLGRSARFNIPGTKNDNWSWRLESMQELDITIDKLKELNENNSRVN